jgi:hypothetical protein
MTYDILGRGPLDYVPCTYGTSKLVFRGPKRVLTDPYVAFIGGTTTFGKFIQQPFPLLVEHQTGVTSVNFGQANAGLDVFSHEPCILEAAKEARVTVLEVLGAINTSNAYYRVHPRRNDRFLRPERQLQHLYPDVDFSQFNFVRHMLRHLYHADARQFSTLQKDIQALWMLQMRELLPHLSPEVVLIRFGGGEFAGRWMEEGSGGAAMVTDSMLDELGGSVSALVDVSVDRGDPKPLGAGMVFDMMEQPAARAVHSPAVHNAASQALRPVLDRLM